MIWNLREYDKYKHPECRADLLPFNFSTLLNILSEKQRKETLRADIFKRDKEMNSTEAKNDLKRFLYLFKTMNAGKAEMMSPDAHIFAKVRFFLEY